MVREKRVWEPPNRTFRYFGEKLLARTQNSRESLFVITVLTKSRKIKEGRRERTGGSEGRRRWYYFLIYSLVGNAMLFVLVLGLWYGYFHFLCSVIVEHLFRGKKLLYNYIIGESFFLLYKYLVLIFNYVGYIISQSGGGGLANNHSNKNIKNTKIWYILRVKQ